MVSVQDQGRPGNNGVDPAVIEDFAPEGRLRVALNLANVMLVQRNPTNGELSGLGVEYATELARRLDLPLDLIFFDTAGEIVNAASTGRWDVAFLAIEPSRAAELDFTAPYTRIEGAYLVREAAAFRTAADVDQAGVSIAVSAGSAIDAYLSKTIRKAKLVRARGDAGAKSIDLFLGHGLDALAGGRQQLVEFARDHPGLRVMEDNFMLIEQGLSMPKGRSNAIVYLRNFVEEMTGIPTNR